MCDMNNMDGATDRRAAGRYSIQEDVRWSLRDRQDVLEPGKTVNISSAGVLFDTGSFAPQGTLVDVAINWPVPTDTGAVLQLMARGRVVRFSDGRAAVQFHQTQFRRRQA